MVSSIIKTFTMEEAGMTDLSQLDTWSGRLNRAYKECFEVDLREICEKREKWKLPIVPVPAMGEDQ